MTSIGERIYDLRNRNNMSQGNLADKLDVSRQTISKWENNMCLPEAEKLLQLSEIFGVSIDYILKGETEAQQTQEPVYIYVKDPEGAKYDEKTLRKYAGLVLSAVCGVLTIIFALESSIFILLTAPMTVLGVLLAINLKHPILVFSWLLYAVIMVAAPYYSSVTFLPHAIFMLVFSAIKNSDKLFLNESVAVLGIHSLLMWLPLPILILCTIKAKRGYIFRPKDNS